MHNWILKVSTLKIDGKRESILDAMIERLSTYSLPDESILYIGQTTSQTLKTRVNQYYKHCLGNPRPHSGGHWIKTLSILDETFVHFAELPNPKMAKDQLIKEFIAGISQQTRSQLKDADHPFPFANLEYPKGTIKNPTGYQVQDSLEFRIHHVTDMKLEW